MGLTAAFKRIVNIRRTREDRQPELRRMPYHPRTQSGVLMTADTALSVDAALACIRYLTQTTAGLPWHVYRPVKGGGEIASKNPIEWIIAKRASSEYSSFQFRETMLGWALRYGNAYAEIERDGLGRPIALHPLQPGRTQVRRDRETQALYYEVDSGSFGYAPEGGSTAATARGVRMEPENIFHLRGLGDGPVGLDVMTYAADILGQAKAIQLFGASFFGSGATPSGVVTMKKSLTLDGMKELEARFRGLYAGPRNARKTMFLDNEMDYKTTSVAPNEGQFVESSYLAVESVCRIFGVPPHKVQHLLRATFSNIEYQSIEVVTDSISPWARRFNDEVDYKLLGLETRAGFYSQMDFTDLLRGDAASRVAYYVGLRQIGVFSVNDILARENMPTIGPEGDKRVMQAQFTTLEQIGQQAVTPASQSSPSSGDVGAPAGNNDNKNLAALEQRIDDVFATLSTVERTFTALSDSVKFALDQQAENFGKRIFEIEDSVLPGIHNVINKIQLAIDNVGKPPVVSEIKIRKKRARVVRTPELQVAA